MNIRDLTFDELIIYIEKLGEKSFRASQIFDWLHKKMIANFYDASNISYSLISKMNNDFSFDMPLIKNEYVSKIDGTKKYLIQLNDNSYIESVLMKYKYGYSLCISSQVGCNMGCKFCASTIGGLKRNLDVYELLSQVYLISAVNKIKISNIVIMGCGEPLLNLGNIIKFLNIINDKKGQNIGLRNITISTCGIVEGIYKLMKYNLPLTLALSLHAPSDSIRNKIMPISLKYNLQDVMKAMTDYYVNTNRRITFEYILLDGINSSIDDANDVADLFKKSFNDRHIDYNVNLIPANSVDEYTFFAPCEKDIIAFKKVLQSKNINVTVRRELGKDISGSCGQLRARVG